MRIKPGSANAGLLQRHGVKPRELEAARIFVFNLQLGGGITLPLPFFGPTILLKSKWLVYDQSGQLEDSSSIKMLRHELCHVRQILDWGTRSYLRRQIWARVRSFSLYARSSPEEADCYLAQTEVEDYYLARERGLPSFDENRPAGTNEEITGALAEDLMRRHTPCLVLYPEIIAGSTRPKIEESNYPHDSVLDRDYHPRDINIVLEHSGFHKAWWKFWRKSDRPVDWEEMLDHMEEKGYAADLDVFPNTPKSDKSGFWSKYSEIQGKDSLYKRACYARVVRCKIPGKDRIVIQYWYAYLYNDFWNAHEMDWETVMVVLRGVDDHSPLICAYSAHEGGSWLPWCQVDKVDDVLQPAVEGTHPVVYVASGSHANYFYGPAIYRIAPPALKFLSKFLGKILAKVWPSSDLAKLLNQVRQPIDYTRSTEDGESFLIEARLIPTMGHGPWEGEWRWLNHTGRWGSPGQSIGLGDAGPHGPPLAERKWGDPLWWIAAECHRAPQQDEVQVPTRLARSAANLKSYSKTEAF